MHESILIKNSELFLPIGRFTGDILLKGQEIVAIEPSIQRSADLIINDKGLAVFPGFVDSHVHFRSPGISHKESFLSGGQAALAGGVTCVCDMPNTAPPTLTQKDLEEKLSLAHRECPIAFFGYIGASKDNLEELQQESLAKGIKIFVGSSTGNMLVDDQKSLELIFKNTKGLICVHAEDEQTVLANQEKYKGSKDVKDHANIRSREAALKATKRLVELAFKFKRRLHLLHITTQEETAYLAQLAPNPFVTAEVCIPHLFAYGPEVYDEYGCLAQVNPPIRNKSDFLALRQGLKRGLFLSVSTDHAPHLLEEKQQDFGSAPSGMPSIQYAFPLLLDAALKGHWSIENVLDWYAKHPAKLLKETLRGELKVGNYADCVLVDLKGNYTIDPKKHFSKAKWSVFDHHTLQGRIISTISNGQVRFQEGEYIPLKS